MLNKKVVKISKGIIAPIYFLLLLTFSSCSTKKNTYVSCAYHGTTTHYNYFFNARERVRQGATTLAAGQQDKYDRILPIFQYGDANSAKGIFPDMDEAIKKASIAIQRHSIYTKSKKDPKLAERNIWIDDCYFVIGQAQFYKHDFWTAIETFQYTSSEYKTGDVRFEALIWLTRAYLELGKTTDAEYLLDYLKNEKEFPVRLKGDYAATAANFYLIRNNIPKAIEELEHAASNTRKKDVRSRYYFILGQLLQKQDSIKGAFSAYSKVIKLNPPYELAFNARINRARCFDVNSENGESVKKELNKMLKDDKNVEYLDQIYYALAGIAQQEKKENEAIKYLDFSIFSSTTNTNQKALSYKALGDIYYARPEYLPASEYYDSCIVVLSNEHPDYYEILQRRNSLEKLVKNLKIITMEDSLQSLARLTPAEREMRINAVIEREAFEQERIKQEQEEKQRIEELQVLEEKQLKSQPRNYRQPGVVQQGEWYFYNPASLSAGVKEFMKKWGFRKLEDNWRRVDKEAEITIQQDEPSSGISVDSLADSQKALSDSLANLDADKRKDAYLKAIPESESQLKESNARVTEAYYNVGIIYKEQLANFKESIESFEELDQRYPANKYKLPSYYNLYRLYMALNDSINAAKYKDYLITNYPESEYSKLLLNPNYFAEAKKKTAVLQVFYENTYRAYLNGQYSDVIERKTLADTLFSKNNALSGKFALLKALAIGKSQSVGNFEIALEDVVRNFPKDTVSVRAKDILAFIKARNEPATTGDSLQSNQTLNSIIDSTAYSYAPDSPHLFLILTRRDAGIDINETKGKITSFNNGNFSSANLQIMTGNIDLSWAYIAVSGFNNKQSAMNYYSSIVQDPNVLVLMEGGSTQFFVISPTNLTQLAKTKDIQKYAMFFQDKYLQ